MISAPPVETSVDQGSNLKKPWADWFLEVFRNLKYKGSGATSDRPLNGLNIGDWFFDTALTRPVFVTAVSPVTWTDILGFLGFSDYFESAEQTITSAGALTIAHGLGREPILLWFTLVCKTDEDGWVAGDEVHLGSVAGFGFSASRSFGVKCDTTNILVRYGSNADVFDYVNFTTGGAVALTNTNWRLVIRAWG